MYYEEKIINGILCWRGAPDGIWTQKSPAELTSMILEARRISSISPPSLVYGPIKKK